MTEMKVMDRDCLLRELDPIEDLEEAADLFDKAFSREPWNDDWHDRSLLLTYLRELLDENNALAYGLFRGERLIGLCLGRKVHFYQGIQFRIDEICIDPCLQGKGYGSLLLSKVEKACRKEGISYLLLVTERDYPAYSFYRKNGFDPLEKSVALCKKIKDEEESA